MNICESICPCNQCDTEPEGCELAKVYQVQTPKKAIVGLIKMQCPTCGEIINSKDRFCKNCGQAIWHLKASAEY
jgi:ribosomal protein S27AE